jgi:hypothetical protein
MTPAGFKDQVETHDFDEFSNSCLRPGHICVYSRIVTFQTLVLYAYGN